METKAIKHCFNVRTWIKIENRARREGKTPEAVASLFLDKRVGVTPPLLKHD